MFTPVWIINRSAGLIVETIFAKQSSIAFSSWDGSFCTFSLKHTHPPTHPSAHKHSYTNTYLRGIRNTINRFS